MAGLVDILGAAGNQNIQGEDQQKLDVFANRKFIQVINNPRSNDSGNEPRYPAS